MTPLDVLAALGLATIALYGLGLPLAWLLPAPEHSAWVLRIALAPLYAIVVASAGAWALAVAGVALDPRQLVVLLLVAWTAAAVRTRDQWALRRNAANALGPVILIATSAMLWLLSLVGYGLYLPNRDFKNHAVMVAQVAWTSSPDPSLVLRPSPVSAPAGGGFYPLGLHTLLGWVLPSDGFPTPAVTAASAVVVTAVSLPLAMVVLARLWDPESRALEWVAGVAAVFAIGLSSAFPNGSLLLLTGTALYPAALAGVWWFVRHPSGGSFLMVVLCGLGLLLMHVAEAVALGLVALACLPAMWMRRGDARPSAGVIALVVGCGVVAVAVSWALVDRMASYLGQDDQANTEDPLIALLVALIMQPEGHFLAKAAWLILAAAGFWLCARRKLSWFPLLALAIPVGLGTLAGMRGLPPVLDLLTAPWYGSAARTGFLALAPIALAGSLALVRLREATRTRPLGVLALAVALVAVTGLAVQVVPMRRQALADALAGAGDTPAVARALAQRMEPGETVLNLEGDGTANLFAFQRIPVLSGLWSDPRLVRTVDGEQVDLTEQLLRLDDPSVRAWIEELGVAYVAIGTTSRYWSQQTGYAWQALTRQEQLSPVLSGTDLVILRYQGEGR